MTNPSIILKDGSEIPEGIMDAFLQHYVLYTILKTKIIRDLDLFIVKPKCMGQMRLNLQIYYLKSRTGFEFKKDTIKVGIMDEERTTLNLKECIRNVKERIVLSILVS